MSENRYPNNVTGDFYTEGYELDGEWYGVCTACGLPEMEAPDLLAPLDESNSNTYFKKQARTEAEVQRAIAALEICCVDALRYGGKGKSILRQLDSSLCDFRISMFGRVVPNKEYTTFVTNDRLVIPAAALGCTFSPFTALRDPTDSRMVYLGY